MLRLFATISLLTLAAFAAPSEVQGQVGECWECTLYDYGDGNGYTETCWGATSGHSNCAQQGGGGGASACLPYGEPDCETETMLDGSVSHLGALDLSTYALGLLGERDGDLVRRHCDGAVVARLLTSTDRAAHRLAAKTVIL